MGTSVVMANFSSLSSNLAFTIANTGFGRAVYIAGIEDGTLIVKHYEVDVSGIKNEFTNDYSAKGTLLSGCYSPETISTVKKSKGYLKLFASGFCASTPILMSKSSSSSIFASILNFFDPLSPVPSSQSP